MCLIKMPYSKKQHGLFEAAAKSKGVAKKADIPQAIAKRLAAEGVKKSDKKSK